MREAQDVQPDVQPDVQWVVQAGVQWDVRADVQAGVDSIEMLLRSIVIPKIAQLSSWAIFICLMLSAQLTAIAILDQNVIALYLSLLPILCICGNKVKKIIVVTSLWAVSILTDPNFMVIGYALALFFVGYKRSSIGLTIIILFLSESYPYLQSIPDQVLNGINLTTLISLLFPNLVVIILFKNNLRLLTKFIFINLVTFCFILAASGWVFVDLLITPFYRVCLALIPTIIFIVSTKNSQLLSLEVQDLNFKYAYLLSLFAVLLVSYLGLNEKEVRTVVFDESHGSWETVNSTFNKNDFGRGVNYTYSLLSKYAEKLVGKSAVFEKEDSFMPDLDSLFVLKMPSKELSKNFSNKLNTWVKSGGSLLIVADHTDLYDTTQNINQFLSEHSGANILDHAVFDAVGMPNEPQLSPLSRLIGRLDAHQDSFSWQTGTSFGIIPLGFIQLASYGLSFSEPGNYANPNRFGSFNPHLNLRYMNHSSLGAWSHGSGMIVVLLDSTPWSNFSLHKQQYKQLFKSVIDITQKSLLVKISGVIPFVLLCFLVLLMLVRDERFLLIGTFLIVFTLCINISISRSASKKFIEGIDYKVKVISGKNANQMFLRQLIPTGEHNFSRIVSSLNKYDLDPISFSLGKIDSNLLESKNSLLIEPEIYQLPEATDLFSYIRSGKNFTILFSPHQSSDPKIQAWLRSLGLIINSKSNNGLVETFSSEADDLISRTGPFGIKQIVRYVMALPSSQFKFQNGDNLVQSFTIRPTQLPKTSGNLNISFSSDQYSDDVIGDVWEGVRPTVIGKHREAHLASVIIGEEFPKFSEFHRETFHNAETNLDKYLILKDGSKYASGNLKNITIKSANASQNIEHYLLSLLNKALYHVKAQCQSQEELLECNYRLTGYDMIEWFVTVRRSKAGKIDAIELIHERHQVGMSSTWNVIFGN